MEKIYYKKAEMLQLGYTEHILKRICHAEGAPVIRTGAGGNYLYRLKDIDDFIKVINERDTEQKRKKAQYEKMKRALRRRA